MYSYTGELMQDTVKERESKSRNASAVFAVDCLTENSAVSVLNGI